jgi:superfamily II DNA or RNA helicase
VLFVLATGGGKTIVFAFITMNAAAKGNSIILLAHRQEITDQISAALTAMGVVHGRIQPGHPMTTDLVQVGMVQTVARRLGRLTEPALLVIDEAHHAVAGTWSMIAAAWPDAKILGVTATPERLDGVGLREAFDEIVIGPTSAN